MSSQARVFGDRTFNAIGYGGMGLSFAYGQIGADEERLKVVNLHVLYYWRWPLAFIRTQVLDAVYDSGCTFWDTTDLYGDNEDLIGKWYVCGVRRQL